MPSSLSPHQQQLLQQREELRAGLVSAVEDEADPLDAYDNFVKWTLQNHANHSESGLLELLEEAVRKFKDDVRYKSGDLRYVKLWILFANHVEKPAEVYAYMFQEGIGKPYALFFEEYAEALEREGRFEEVETVITLGMRTQAKPLKHLQAFHSNYTARRAARKPLPAKVSQFRESGCPPAVSIIRARPLQNIAPQHPEITAPAALTVPTASHHDVSMTTTHALPIAEPRRPNPYAHLNAPAPSGKRPEKLQFDLTLLLDPDGTEYCFEEARARHLGLLGKKWPAPPPPNSAGSSTVPAPASDGAPRERSVKVNFNDQGTKTGKRIPRQSVTVTINTKQALEDVFDMYNSPVKENDADEEGEDGARPRTAELHRSQHTPVPARPIFRDENAGTATKPRPFQPFADQRRENVTPGPLKFMPVTTKTPGPSAFTPSAGRKALVAKEIITPVPAFKVVRPEQNATTPTVPPELRPLAEDPEPEELDVFGGDDVTANEFTEEFANPPPPAPRLFVPFVDEEGGQPTAQRNENAAVPATTKILKFQVHRDENAPPGGPPRKATRTPNVGSQTFFRPMMGEVLRQSDDDEDRPGAPSERTDNACEERQRFVKSGRFADFDVMTPITERTFEFTTSTRAAGTPLSEGSTIYDKGFVALDAQDVAEKLAAELQADEKMERDSAVISAQTPFLGPDILGTPDVNDSASGSEFSFYDRPGTAPFRVSDGFTIERKHSNLLSSGVVVDVSNTDDVTQVLNARFEPPNPCVPTDPAILSQLMSAFPPDPAHRMLRNTTANKLATLQKFAEKRARRGSGASSSGRTSDGSDKLVLDLDGDQFEFLEKLGEGGFGAVFMAKQLRRPGEANDDEYDEYGEDEDEDDSGLVAVKVVRPANQWESFILRRIAAAVPEDVRRSIVRAHTLYAFQDESYLVLDLCPQGTLLEIVNRAAETGVAQPGGGVDELLAMFFTAELLRAVEALHARGFIHGDLKIDNCLVRLGDGAGAWDGAYRAGAGAWAHKGVTLVDFGRAVDTALFPAGQAFVADWAPDARDCAEMRAGGAWTFQSDYAGLAGVAYCMLFGKYIETVEVGVEADGEGGEGGEGAGAGRRRLRPAQPMKRYWQAELWTRLFDTLLNPRLARADGALPITAELAALRAELEAWMAANCTRGGKNLKGMLKKIELATLRRAPRR